MSEETKWFVGIIVIPIAILVGVVSLFGHFEGISDAEMDAYCAANNGERLTAYYGSADLCVIDGQVVEQTSNGLVIIVPQE